MMPISSFPPYEWREDGAHVNYSAEIPLLPLAGMHPPIIEEVSGEQVKG